MSRAMPALPLDRPFDLPIAFHLSATFLLAATGALEGARKRYDVVGISVLAFVTGIGGAIARDTLLQSGLSPVLHDGRWLLAVIAGAVAGGFFGRRLHRLRLVISVADAAALGIYGVIGTQKSLAAGLPVVSACLVGVVNAVGGGVLRDVLAREEPLIFKPGQFYALASLFGCLVFAGLTVPLDVPSTAAAIAAIAVAFLARILSMWRRWTTVVLEPGDIGP
jgi:uncharacterized membrane protein YeiH